MYTNEFVQKTLDVTFPRWATWRGNGWRYCGWIANPPAIGTFEEHYQAMLRSDHGEQRGVDVYPEGATCWFR